VQRHQHWHTDVSYTDTSGDGIVNEYLMTTAQKLAAPQGFQPRQKHQAIESALTYARGNNLERRAVTDERDLIRVPLQRSMGQARFAEVRGQFESRVLSGELIEVAARSPSHTFTTQEMIDFERIKDHDRCAARQETRVLDLCSAAGMIHL